MDTATNLEAFLAQPDPLHKSARTESPLRKEIASVLLTMSRAAARISHLVSEADMADIMGEAGATNASGDTVMRLDVEADSIVGEELNTCADVRFVGSEEAIGVRELNKTGVLAVFHDPLDGSSNIEAQIPVGTIFSIYKANAAENDRLPSGREQIAAGYFLYSSSTILVASVGGPVFFAIYQPLDQTWHVTRDSLRIPENAWLYSFNESNFTRWAEPIQQLVGRYKNGTSAFGKPLTLRFIGSLVADAHRNLLYGGVYAYPGDTINPQGKLRLMYECNPISWLYEKAGGSGSNGFKSILDCKASSLHQKTPFFLGSTQEIQEIENMIVGYKESA